MSKKSSQCVNFTKICSSIFAACGGIISLYYFITYLIVAQQQPTITPPTIPEPTIPQITSQMTTTTFPFTATTNITANTLPTTIFSTIQTPIFSTIPTTIPTPIFSTIPTTIPTPIFSTIPTTIPTNIPTTISSTINTKTNPGTVTQTTILPTTTTSLRGPTTGV
jgi:hypothetical protein